MDGLYINYRTTVSAVLATLLFLLLGKIVHTLKLSFFYRMHSPFNLVLCVGVVISHNLIVLDKDKFFVAVYIFPVGIVYELFPNTLILIIL